MTWQLWALRRAVEMSPPGRRRDTDAARVSYARDMQIMHLLTRMTSANQADKLKDAMVFLKDREPQVKEVLVGCDVFFRSAPFGDGDEPEHESNLLELEDHDAPGSDESDAEWYPIASDSE
jgi:hypothetical protein